MHSASARDNDMHAQEALEILSGVQDCTSKMEVRLSCKDLHNLDGMCARGKGKSDPFCVLFEKDFKSGLWTERGRTEVAVNDLSAHFCAATLVTCLDVVVQCACMADSNRVL